MKKESRRGTGRVIGDGFFGGLGLVRKSGGFASALKSKRGPPRSAGPTKPRENQEGRASPAPTEERETREHRLKPMLRGALRLGVGFDEPEIFVHFAGDAGEEVDGDGVFEVVGFLDGGAQGVGEVTDVVDQEFHHVRAIVG